MNKKAYIYPETAVVMVNVETAMLAGSGGALDRDSDNGTVTIIGTDGEYNGTVNSRSGSLWDDED